MAAGVVAHVGKVRDSLQEGFLPFARPDIGPEEVEAVSEVLENGWITTGPKVHELEAKFRDFVGATCAVALNSCTAALHLGLEAMGLREGDEVITTPYTFASTAEVIRYFDATPVFADVEAETLNLDPEAVESAISPRTKVLLPVHLGGRPADLSRLYEIAARHGLAVLEDCAHALPARYGGRIIGQDLDRARYRGIPAHASCFSFYATKSMTTGEGGMLCTGDADLAARVRIMSLHGMSNDAWNRYSEEGSWYYEIVAPGFKYNMTDVAAALGVVQLRRLEAMWKRRQEIASLYSELLADCEALQLPTDAPDGGHAWHLYTVRLRTGMLAIDRAGFIQELKARGIGCSVHFIPLHVHPYYRDEYGFRPSDFPVAQREYERAVSLPIYSAMSPPDASRVVEAVREVLAQHTRR